jgi:hypothetical protein
VKHPPTMKNLRPVRLMLLLGSVLLLMFTSSALGLSQTNDQLRTPAADSPEYRAILDAVREEYKEGADQPAKFRVNYLKVHQGWAWIDVTPLNKDGEPVADPAPLLFFNDNGRWTARDLSDVPTQGEGHTGPHNPDAKFAEALQKKYPGVPADIIPISSQAGDSIQTIRDRYATINKGTATHKSVKKKLSGFSAGGGDLTAYFDGPKIMKIVASHLGESGKAVEEYYYWDDRLIFIYRKDSIYDSPSSGKVARTQENRFYFDNDRLIRWIDGNAKQVESSNSEYQEKEKDYLKLSREFANGARSQNSIIESAQ